MGERVSTPQPPLHPWGNFEHEDPFHSQGHNQSKNSVEHIAPAKIALASEGKIAK
jgi:hypothetical protein